MSPKLDLARRESLAELAARADEVPFPDDLLVHRVQRHGGIEHAYIALKPMSIGSRRVQSGDLLRADEETAALDRMVAHGQVAQLPLDSGVLALVIGLRAKVELLKAERR